MKYLIDCGATHARIAFNDSIKQFVSVEGFNPQNGIWDEFESRLLKFFNGVRHPATEITFYGAGLFNEEMKTQMTGLLERVTGLCASDIAVHSDLFAAAHAAYEGNPVIIGILGTGSNVGHYDGERLTRQTPSLGYLLADEGSGVDLGKRLLLAYHYGRLEESIKKRMEVLCDLNIETVIRQLYGEGDFRKYVSPLSRMVGEFREDEVVRDLIGASFLSYIENRLHPEVAAHFEVQTVCLFGSVAYAFRQELIVLIRKRLEVDVEIIRDPIECLL